LFFSVFLTLVYGKGLRSGTKGKESPNLSLKKKKKKNVYILVTGDEAEATTEADDGTADSDDALSTGGDMDELLRQANGELGGAVHTDRGKREEIKEHTLAVIL
jgi:hypothetical protein